MQWVEQGLNWLGGLIWGPPTIVLLLGIGIFFTIRLRFVQIRYFPRGLRLVTRGGSDNTDGSAKFGDISPVKALGLSLSTTIGNGNIAGVCTAITMGGPGAVFWMWVAAAFGMATKLVEAALGQRFREITLQGNTVGGPMYYLSRKLGLRKLGAIFALVMGVKVLLSTSIVQGNSIAVALDTQFGFPRIASGLFLAFVTGLVILGGLKSIARAAAVVAPFMMVLFFIGGSITIGMFFNHIQDAFRLILVGAFNPQALGGGAAGVTVATAIRYGLARGTFSNEAGTGTAAVIHAPAKTSEPVRQGLIASLDVFLDTFVVCSFTALTVLVTGAWLEADSTAMAVTAFNSALPGIGGGIVALSSLLFGFSSLFGATYYGETAMFYLFGPRIRYPYRIVFCLLIILGSGVTVHVAWAVGDLLNGLMTLINLVGLIGLSGFVVKMVRSYDSRTSLSPILHS